MLKKVLSIVLSALICAAMCVCGVAEEASQSSDDLQESKTESAGVTIEYPENMQARGYTEPVVLETTPQRVACLSSSPVLALYEMGVPMVAIPTSSVVDWPEDLAASAEQLQMAHNTNFDVETVIALEPDLVIMGYTSQETYGNVVSAAGIPVYYVDARPLTNLSQRSLF